MSGFQKLMAAKKLLQEFFIETIIRFDVNPSKPFMKITFRDSTILYIRYNDFNEYPYQIIYSEDIDDWCRFDNYDQFWDVKSRPHHFHPHGDDPAIESEMIGSPEKDIPKLFKYIK